MPRWTMILLAGLSLSLVACDTDEETGDSEESDTDTDVDTDADVDTCETNSAWPCTCDIPGYPCDDGADCITLKGLGDGTQGYCAAQCMGKGASCPDTPYGGLGQCLVGDGTNNWCVLICSGADDCPPDQACDTSLGTGLCYPV
ncbi:MAG: hypothetical protein JXB39_12480 [Deltaproteobacteria bacterium]|nr:hypothetical protein [Deltaproteobacteria bacterium]